MTTEAPPNNRLELTKPAQAMGFRSSSECYAHRECDFAQPFFVGVRRYQDLVCWQLANALKREVYALNELSNCSNLLSARLVQPRSGLSTFHHRLHLDAEGRDTPHP